MLVAIVFFNVWGVLQLVALGSFARTVRVRTVLAGIVVGLFFCAPFAAVLEHTWAAAIAVLTGSPLEAVIAVTGYTVDPPIEEIIRVLPLAFLLLVPVIRRQLSVTDCVLIGAAAGAGFGLAEDLYRFGTAPQYATAVPGGWVAPFQSPILESASQRVFIPSIATALSGWLPDMGGFRLFGLSSFMLPNLLLIWSSLAGLAVGLWLRLEGPARWIAAAALFAYASSAHAAHNADVTFGHQLLVTAPFRALSVLQPLMPIAALAIAWWIDRHRQGDVAVEHLLAAEQHASPRALGTWRAVVARMPESIFWVERFVRVRRAYNTERLLGGAEAENLRAAISDVRNEIDCQLRRPGSWRASAWAWAEQAWRKLRQPATIVWIVLTLPATLWFVVGGWPATAGVQRLLSDGAAWWLVVGLTVVAQAWMALGMLFMLRSWHRLLHLPVGDPGAALVLGFVGGTGALGFGAFGISRASAPVTAGVAHVRDALESLTLSQVFPLADLAAALWNLLFRPSPGDLHIPYPGTERGFFTPTGLRQTALNSAIDRLDQILNTLDPFRVRPTLGKMDPHYHTLPRMKVGSGDPNDMSENVGTLAVYLAEQIVGIALLFGGGFATGQGSAPTARSSVDPLAATSPGPQRSPLATTLPPQRSPLATTLPPQQSPLASTLPPQQSPLASTLPSESAQVGFADTQPAPVPGPAPPNPAPPAQPRAVPPGESPYGVDP
jgi:hypothetical protein